MKKEDLFLVAKEAVNESELSSAEVPAIDLYVDQIINLVADKQRSGSERFLERQLTKTMINNYSKDGLISPVKGKKYNKEQIIQILTVYTLKNTLSIGEIKRLLQGAYATEGFDGDSLIQLYDRYMEIKEANREYTEDVLNGLLERNSLDVENETECMLTIGALLSLSAFLRQTAQGLIDLKYPAPEEPEDKEKEKEEKEKAKDREKEEKEKTKAKEKEEKDKQKKEKKKKDEAVSSDVTQ
jgi:ATP-dependent Clp protease ATP-binding subunit ClpA